MKIVLIILVPIIALFCLYLLCVGSLIALLYRFLGWGYYFKEKILPAFDLGKDDDIVI